MTLIFHGLEICKINHKQMQISFCFWLSFYKNNAIQDRWGKLYIRTSDTLKSHQFS
ncbi:unnamed protein product [Paramecium primaurelia]|uniref:Uncharacterized protein n=1 Tax=Paramecium primaurelia TaxID=5886 RepID=A0A8S1QIP3_PARPR|nr:unnamed protein product [Paramecium primaurelia]